MRVDRSKKPWHVDPEVRAFTELTEIPDGFPAASEFRRAGYSTYLAIFRMPLEELAALEDMVGPDVTRAILALRQTSVPATDEWRKWNYVDERDTVAVHSTETPLSRHLPRIP